MPPKTRSENRRVKRVGLASRTITTSLRTTSLVSPPYIRPSHQAVTQRESLVEGGDSREARLLHPPQSLAITGHEKPSYDVKGPPFIGEIDRDILSAGNEDEGRREGEWGMKHRDSVITACGAASMASHGIACHTHASCKV